MTLSDITQSLIQTDFSGGIHTSPHIRLLLYAIAGCMEATEVMETGYDAGKTTEVLCQTNANITAIDNHSEYADVKRVAQRILSPYPNCLIVDDDIVHFVQDHPDLQFDLVYIDDNHDEGHVYAELSLIKNMVRPGGIIVFHDVIQHEHILRAIDHLLPEWNIIVLSARSPNDGIDYGVAIAQKPRI